MRKSMKETIDSAKTYEIPSDVSRVGSPPVLIPNADGGVRATKAELKQAGKCIEADNEINSPGDDDFGTIDKFFEQMAQARRYNPYLGDAQFKKAVFVDRHRLLAIHGVKGGPGKSTVAVALIDLLISLGYKLVLIEGDRGTPDVGPAYADHPAVRMVRLDCSELQGIRELVKFMGHGPRVIVLNCGSGYDRTFQEFGNVLARAMDHYNYHMTCFFALNSQANSVEQLVKFHRAMPTATVHAVLNLKESKTEDVADFQDWADSPDREGLEGQGRTLIMPYGPLGLMNRMSKEGVSFARLAGDASRDLTDRQLLDNFLRSMWSEFHRVFDFERRS